MPTFEGSCQRKVRIATRKAAARRAEELGMRQYRCEWCKGWHLTSDTKFATVPRTTGGTWAASRKRWLRKQQ